MQHGLSGLHNPACRLQCGVNVLTGCCFRLSHLPFAIGSGGALVATRAAPDYELALGVSTPAQCLTSWPSSPTPPQMSHSLYITLAVPLG